MKKISANTYIYFFSDGMSLRLSEGRAFARFYREKKERRGRQGMPGLNYGRNMGNIFRS